MKASGRPAAGTSHITHTVCVRACECVDRDGRVNENERCCWFGDHTPELNNQRR